MFTDPKSGDYLAWFFCTKEQTRGQMAYFSRNGCVLEHPSRSSQDDSSSISENYETVSDYPFIASQAKSHHNKDIVDLIKRARARTDRTLALLQRNNEEKEKGPDAVRNPLETFIGGFAHHFNNLFMNIQCNVSLILSARMHDHRHQRRLKRIEKLVSTESMLTNDLLGIVIEKGCYIDKKLQTHLLDEIVDIADTLIMRQAFCTWDDTQSYEDNLSGDALKRLASGLSGIMHQLLNEVHDHAAFIISDNSADVVEHVRLRNILKTVEQGRQLLRDLTGNDKVRLASAEYTDVRAITEVVFDVCYQAHDDIRTHFTINSNLCDVKADRAQIAAILNRLYDNSVAAMPSGGEIFLTLDNYSPITKGTHDRFVRLIFKDSGIGMAPDISARIFDPFFTSNASQTGRGLGLTSVAGMLQNIEGYISVKSKPGKGSIFTIDLPAAVNEQVKWRIPSNVYYPPIKRSA